jgi:tubulin monoglycylase TTLL3/8
MTYDNQIFKFKENIHSYNKILKEMEHSLLPRKQNADQVQIYIKEDKKIKKYEEKSLSDKNSSNSEENCEKEKEHQKTKSEPKIEIEENTDKNDNNTTKKEKTFCIMGHFPDFVEALTKRNWKQITDSDKLNYDLLIALKITDVPFDLLDENITINHLRKIGELTKKTGLLKNLRNLYYLNISPDDFYPRAYDISERQDIQDFIEDFKVSKAISLLRKCQELNGKNVNKKEIETALKIVKAKLDILIGTSDLQKKFENVKTRTFNRTYEKNEVFDIPKISDEDWEIISNENITFYKEQISRMQRSGLIPKEAKLVTNTVVNNNNKNNNRTNKPNLNNKNKKGKKIRIIIVIYKMKKIKN